MQAAAASLRLSSNLLYQMSRYTKLFLIVLSLDVCKSSTTLGQKCEKMESVVVLPDGVPSFLEVRFEMPDLDNKTIKSVDVSGDTLVKLRKKLDAFMQLGHTGADAMHFKPVSVHLTASFFRPSGLMGVAEMRVAFNRIHRHHRLKAPMFPNVTSAVLVVPLIELADTKVASAQLAKFFHSSSSGSAPYSDLPIGSALRESFGDGSRQGAMVIDGKDLAAHHSNDCANTTMFVVLAKPMAIPANVALKMLDNSQEETIEVSSDACSIAAFELALFPAVGHFTKEELEYRQKLYMSVGACSLLLLLVLAVLAINRKNRRNLGYSKVDVGDTVDSLAEPLTTTERASSAPETVVAVVDDAEVNDLVDDAEVNGRAAKITSFDDLAARSLLAKANLDSQVESGCGRRRMHSVMCAALYVQYVCFCTFFPFYGTIVATCYEGLPWESHLPFLGLFLVMKLFEIYTLAFNEDLKGNLDRRSFIVKFMSSWFGLSDGYTDTVGMSIARACLTPLWIYMAIFFYIGVVVFQWIVLGILAVYLDRSGKCLYKVMHMDAVAACVDFHPDDKYAPLLWKVINWARCLGEDLPQVILQTIFIIKIRKNLVMIISVAIAVASSLFAVWNAANFAVQYGREQLAQATALSKAQQLLEEDFCTLEDIERALKEAMDCGLAADNVVIKALEDKKKDKQPRAEVISASMDVTVDSRELAEEAAASALAARTNGVSRVPVVTRQEVVIEVPEIEVRELIKEVPVVQVQVVPKEVRVKKTMPGAVQYIEKIVEVPMALMEEKAVEVPQILQTECLTLLPREKVEFVGDIDVDQVMEPRVEEVEKAVAKRVIELVERIVEVPAVEVQEQIVEILDEENGIENGMIEVLRQVPKPETTEIPKEIPTVEMQYYEKQIEYPAVIYKRGASK